MKIGEVANETVINQQYPFLWKEGIVSTVSKVKLHMFTASTNVLGYL